jgi:hypothetical protein
MNKPLDISLNFQAKPAVNFGGRIPREFLMTKRHNRIEVGDLVSIHPGSSNRGTNTVNFAHTA